MPRRALVERRPWLLGSLAAALVYAFLRDGSIAGLYLIGWKGAACALLAIYAVLRHASTDARLLAGAMAVSAAADMAFELDPVAAIALSFFAMLFALALFLRNPRAAPTRSQRAAAAALLLLIPLIAFLRVGSLSVALYMLAAGAMGGAAWLSRFPRYRVGVGALLVVGSRLLGVGNWGGAMNPDLYDTLGWGIYYAGQFLICTGVIQTLRHEPR